MKLRHWYAVHGSIEVSPQPVEMLDSLRPQVSGLDYDFELGDGLWLKGCFRMSEAGVPAILVHRWRSGEEGFLGGIGVEGCEVAVNAMPDEPHREYVLSHIRKARQTVSLIPVSTILGHSRLARMCEQLCGYIARASDGLIHVYQEGFFSPEGESLLPYCPRHHLKTR